MEPMRVCVEESSECIKGRLSEISIHKVYLREIKTLKSKISVFIIKFIRMWVILLVLQKDKVFLFSILP